MISVIWQSLIWYYIYIYIYIYIYVNIFYQQIFTQQFKCKL